MMILSIVRQMVKGKVSDFTLKELKALDFGFYKGEKFKGESIPTFDEVLDLADNFSQKLLIEIKSLVSIQILKI